MPLAVVVDSCGLFQAASGRALLRALTVVAVLKQFPRDWQNEDRLGSTVTYCSDMEVS